MGISTTFSESYTTATVGVSQLVPYPFALALAGRNFMVDTSSESFFRGSVPIQREQADQSAEPGEHTLSRQGLWRIAQSTWHKGAGQAYLDRPESDRARFRSSKGIDIWTKWQISLLPDTLNKRASANTNLQGLPVGAYQYVVDGNDVLHTQSLTGTPTWTNANIFNGEAAQSVKSLTSDGYNVWAALGSNGVHATTRGATTSSHYNDLAATLVAYVKGRLMAAQGASIFNITASGPAPSATFTQPNTDFSWVGFAAGKKAIYCAGYSGTQSLIYSVTIKADGTGLDVPIQVGTLPTGEVVRSIHVYLNHVQIGTDTGIWVSPDSHEELTLNKVLETTQSVRCLDGQGTFVWAGNTNYDSTSTGLWRLDFRTDTAGRSVITPAYASDLMATAQGNVVSVSTFGDRRFFAVSGVGFFYQDTNLVASGILDSGLITFGAPDLKLAVKLDVRHSPLAGSHKAYISTDAGSFELIGTHSTAGSSSPGTPFDAGERLGDTFEIREELLRAADTTVGPEITRHTLFGQILPERTEVFELPVLLYQNMKTDDGMEFYSDPKEDLDFIVALVRAKRASAMQFGKENFSVFVEDYQFRPTKRTPDPTSWLGTCVIRIKTL